MRSSAFPFAYPTILGREAFGGNDVFLFLIYTDSKRSHDDMNMLGQLQSILRPPKLPAFSDSAMLSGRSNSN